MVGNKSRTTYAQKFYAPSGLNRASLRAIQNLHKLYQNKYKYSGSNDVLYKYLRIFDTKCTNANLEPSDYSGAFPFTLTGESGDYFLSYLWQSFCSLWSSLRHERLLQNRAASIKEDKWIGKHNIKELHVEISRIDDLIIFWSH